MTLRSYSFSQVQQAYTCNKLYKMLNIDKLKPNVAPSGDMAFGSAMHASIHALLEGDDAEETFKTFWDSEKEKGNQYSRYGWESLCKQGPIFLERFRERYAGLCKPLQMEQRLFADIGGVSFEGTPDFVGTFDGKTSIIDFKTSGFRYPREKVICGEQMPGYNALVKKNHGLKIEQYVYIVFIKGEPPSLQKPLIEPVDEARDAHTLDNLLKVCKDLDQKTEFLENRHSCIIGTRKCDFFNTCFKGE